jgi:pimeloyl-ACP methyl ester carboxylesterase
MSLPCLLRAVRDCALILRLRLYLFIVALLGLLAVPATAQAWNGERTAFAVGDAPGPATYDQIWLRKYGPTSAKTVLVLVPGSPSGQATFDLLGENLPNLVPGLAVWTIDRRGNAFEDTTGFAAADPSAALGYYAGLTPLGGHAYSPVTDAQAPFVRKWGLALEANDVHRVVLAARAGGTRRVILGGHSMGASFVPAYAAWDFGGRAGFRDLSGLVLIDGGLLGTWQAALKGTSFWPQFKTVAQAKARLAALGKQSPFQFAGTPLGFPLWIVGVAPELGCQFALDDPDGPSVLQSLASLVPPGLLPPGALPDVPVTNEAFAGFLLSESNLVESLHVRTGQLAASGDPRPWVNGPYSTVPIACGAFTHEPGNAMEWFYPARLDLDLMRGAEPISDNPVARYLGLRTKHLREITTPLYVFQTSLSEGGVLAGANRLLKATKIAKHTFAQNQDMGHLDPLLDVPGQNTFIQTVVPFLKGIVRRAL